MNRHLFKDRACFTLNFWAKADAKVLLFFDMTKYFCIFFHFFLHYFCNMLIFNYLIFCHFEGFRPILAFGHKKASFRCEERLSARTHILRNVRVCTRKRVIQLWEPSVLWLSEQPEPWVLREREQRVLLPPTERQEQRGTRRMSAVCRSKPLRHR